GEDVYLNPNAALHIGLALHELVVNSMSHGALAHPHGHVSLTSRINRKEDGILPPLVLTWSERTDARQFPEAKRFGSVALERVVPHSLEGKATFDVGEDRLVFRLEVPAGNFE